MPMPAARREQLLKFPAAALRSARCIQQAIGEFSPDVLHVQCFSVNGVYATAASMRTGVPLVVSLQGETVMDDNDIFRRSISLRTGLRIGVRRAGVVTGCSRFVLDDAEARFGLVTGRGSVVANGVDLGDRSLPSGFALPFERFVFGVGRVVAKKGFDLLLEAFADLAAEHPDVGLVIGGDGQARPALVEQAAALGLSDRVVFPGTLSRAEVSWAMQNTAVFVLPSRVEPFGIVVLEALRAGCPAVVSAHGGAGEIVRDDREGFVVDPYDRAAMAAAIGRILKDAALATRLRAAALSRVRDFAWSDIAEEYRRLYRSVV